MTGRAVEHWKGLTEAQAADRLAQDGRNELPADRGSSLLGLVVKVLAEPMFMLLIGAAGIYLLLGNAIDALVLACSLLVVVAITVYQERRTDRTLRALRDLSSPRALVIRDGGERRIPAREVVRGDLLLVREGDRIAADAVLRDCVGVAVDESLLTGESVPVSKRADAGEIPFSAAGGDDLPFVYSGTLAVRGHGVAEVIATGPRTQIGAIGRRLEELHEEKTPLQRETARVVRIVAVLGVGLCVLLAALLATRGSLLQGALAGITLAMSLLPEEFPVVLTIFLALGAWRISRHRVLTRRAPVIEALGAATVLAVDKTGTLTENRMEVELVEAGDILLPLRSAAGQAEAPIQTLLANAMGACELDAVDPMDRAIVRAAHTHAAAASQHFTAMDLVREYDVSADLLANVHAWQRSGERRCELMAKGAPEAIAALCRMSGAQRTHWLDHADAHARNGLRVLGVAHATVDLDAVPEDPRDVGFDLDGIIALADPLREGVPQAIAECQAAGIRVVMITGDHPSTALAIARAIGLDTSPGIVTGAQLADLDDGALALRARAVNVYARIVPEQKLRLVEAMKANGEVVAMTGDGVNDAPALKAAHIGVAMGSRGSDVAREAADLVLLDDDFSSLVATVRAGRRIFENIRNAMSYLVAVHIPLGGMGLLPATVGWPLFLFPVHVVFIEFVIDPACSLVFESERGRADLMQRPPRPAAERLFDARLVARATLLGLTMLAAVALSYAIVLSTHGAESARASAFATLIVGNVLLIATSRSPVVPALSLLFRPNAAFLAIAGAVAAALAIVLYWAPAVHLFRFVSPDASDLAMALSLGAASVLWYDVVKVIRARRRRREARAAPE